MRVAELSSGVSIPMLGLGTYLIRSGEAEGAVASALENGYRHVDTAELYRNEADVGRALRSSLPRLGLSSEDVFVTTKLWPKDGRSFKSATQTAQALNASLKALGVDAVDLYLIHAPFNRAQRLEQWQALTELHQAGKARTVGVSNFGVRHIQELLDAGLPMPRVNQIELHPWYQQQELVAFLRKFGILPIAYSSLAPLNTWRSGTRGARGKSSQMQADAGREDSVFARLASKYEVTQAQLLLRWAVQQGFPVLPKSTDPIRQRENTDVFGFTIEPADMTALADLDRGRPLAWGSTDPTRAP